jgi:hypothetical protein
MSFILYASPVHTDEPVAFIRAKNVLESAKANYGRLCARYMTFRIRHASAEELHEIEDQLAVEKGNYLAAIERSRQMIEDGQRRWERASHLLKVGLACSLLAVLLALAISMPG